MAYRSYFEVSSYYSLDEYGLRFYPTGEYVEHLPKTPSNKVKLWRLGRRLTSLIVELRGYGIRNLPDR